MRADHSDHAEPGENSSQTMKHPHWSYVLDITQNLLGKAASEAVSTDYR
jgi:hypothetical protein